jgi:hypothetical protein
MNWIRTINPKNQKNKKTPHASFLASLSNPLKENRFIPDDNDETSNCCIFLLVACLCVYQVTIPYI